MVNMRCSSLPHSSEDELTVARVEEGRVGQDDMIGFSPPPQHESEEDNVEEEEEEEEEREFVRMLNNTNKNLRVE